MSDIVRSNVWRECGQRGIKRLVMVALAGEVTTRGVAEFHHADLAAMCLCEPETISAYLRQLAIEGEIEYEPATGRGATCKVWMPRYGEAMSAREKPVKAVKARPAYGLSASKGAKAVSESGVSDLSGVPDVPCSAAVAPPTRVVSSPPSGETKDQDQPSGAKAPSGSSAAKPPKAPRAKAVRAARPLFDAFCRAWHLPADGGRNPGLAGGFDSRCSEQGATVAEFEAWVREQRQCGDWGKYTRPHSTTDLFLAARDTAAARRGPSASRYPAEDTAEAWGYDFGAAKETHR